MVSLPRLTPLFILTPARFLDKRAAAFLDIESWSEGFEWEQDSWNGWQDTVDPVSKVIDTQQGDCDDYAVVVASWAVANNRTSKLVLCWKPDSYSPAPDHIAVTDGHSVYSSGAIYDMSVEEYLAHSPYNRYRTKRVQ